MRNEESAFTTDLRYSRSAEEWTNRTLAVHERVFSRFVVLPGSEFTIAEITECTYFSPLKPRREFGSWAIPSSGESSSEASIALIRTCLVVFRIAAEFAYSSSFF